MSFTKDKPHQIMTIATNTADVYYPDPDAGSSASGYNVSTTDTASPFVPAVAATGTLTLGGQPTDGDQFVINDGTNTYTFEFDDDASVVETATLRQVVIGGSAALTRAALSTAVNASAILITAGAVSGNDVPLTHDTAGAGLNNAITQPVNVSTELSSAGMADGTDQKACRIYSISYSAAAATVLQLQDHAGNLICQIRTPSAVFAGPRKDFGPNGVRFDAGFRLNHPGTNVAEVEIIYDIV